MAVTFSNTNKPLNPRGQDASPLAYNRAALYSGKALDFDGVGDSVDINNFSLNGYTAFSVCFHKTDNFNTGMIFSSADSISDGVNIYQISPGYFRARLNGVNVVDTTLNVATEKGFFVFTYDGTNAKWYYQAENIDSGTTNQTFAISNTTSTIARQSYAAAQYLNGQIAGFKIFNTALTAAQIADLYNNPEKILPTGVDNTALKLWLPMMEGAGTTAYDGSGNGNHGTIAGATYVNAVGAPVAQTSVIDWNKGVNETAYSEEFNSWSTKDFGVVIVDNDATAPDGQETAATITFAANQVSTRVQDFLAGSFGLKNQIVSVWARVTSGTAPFRFKCSHGGVSDYFSNDLTATTEWQRFSFSQTFGSSAGSGVFYGLYNGTDLASRTLEFWGFQLQTDAATLTPYVPTIGTTQPSPVLLPQGLTTGRDITGVNLFENVRKQGALNLDGNSWAEVHDNASLDFSSGMTLECWVQLDDLNSYQHILGKWNFPSQREFMIYYNAGSNRVDFMFGHNADSQLASFSITATGQWFHLVGTTNGSTITPYVNGVSGTTASQTTALAANNLNLIIGSDNNLSVNQFVDKQLAQPRIYNRALTASEVLRNYNSGKNTYTNS